MSDKEENESSTPDFRFFADRAKTGRAGCKKCKQKIEPNTLRMAKVGPSPFGSGLMKMWHHVDCMFLVFSKQRATTAKIEAVDDIGGWDDLSKEDKEEIIKRLPESARKRNDGGDPLVSDPSKMTPLKPKKTKKGKDDQKSEMKDQKAKSDPNHKDNSFREFRRLCANVANVPGYLDKTKIIKEFITYGTDKESFKGDLLLVIKLLLPGVVKRVYNLQSKQIIKLFSRIFNTDQSKMLDHLDQGDVAETISEYFEKSQKLKPSKQSVLTIQDVDKFLEQLSTLTKEQEQMELFTSIAKQCTANDLKLIIRLIKHDLRIYAGAKHILDAVDENAYQAFQASRDINKIIGQLDPGSPIKGKKADSINVDIDVLVPVLPMLAQMCKSVEEAFKRCPNGMYSEIKYDGERVQVHKSGNMFKYYSRSLKPVLPHKIKTFEAFIPKAFPTGNDLILDSEILMIDTVTGKPLPFGTLGKHKKENCKNANVCLFVFDCLYYNGKSLLNVPLRKRKEILNKNMTEIQHRIVFSEMQEIYDGKSLETMMVKVFQQGLEGLMLKDMEGIYEPGKRHWLKVKKDYLFDGAMADSADLLVLGAWYGTGKKGGMMSVFLMGCLDKKKNVWCTVTKVHTGHDDKTLEKLQTELKMDKISKDITKVPPWLNCTKTMVPDFVAKDPKKMPVWEITGAEFTQHLVHTADGISVRFPRVSKIRNDKNWETATDLEELMILFKKSKETSNFNLSSYSSNSDIAIRKRPHNEEDDPIQSKILKTTKYKIKNPFPDVFVGLKVKLADNFSSQKNEDLKRYIIAYGGDIVEDGDVPTHIIVENKVGDDSQEITAKEIWECVEKKRLVF